MPEQNEPQRPLPPFLEGEKAALPPAPQEAPSSPSDKEELQRKLLEMEKRLQEEREKLLRVHLKSQEEATASARIEVSLKELQERLRREHRDAQQEEIRGKLESKVQELESRLSQEREVWVATLKNGLEARGVQDKEFESHFLARLQETERRLLDEKAQWQRAALAKDEEIRSLRALAEKLKGADAELRQALSEKKWIETRLSDLMQERAEAQARLHAAAEKERELFQLHAELSLSRQQLAMSQERYERDIEFLRRTAREREERFFADQERLRRELEMGSMRWGPMPAQRETQLQAPRPEAGSHAEPEREEVAPPRKDQEALERTQADFHRLKGICGALEKQVAAGRSKMEELKNQWAQREGQIRADVEAQAAAFQQELLELRRRLSQDNPPESSDKP
jgi:hypothetical protein